MRKKETKKNSSRKETRKKERKKERKRKKKKKKETFKKKAKNFREKPLELVQGKMPLTCLLFIDPFQIKNSFITFK